MKQHSKTKPDRSHTSVSKCTCHHARSANTRGSHFTSCCSNCCDANLFTLGSNPFRRTLDDYHIYGWSLLKDWDCASTSNMCTDSGPNRCAALLPASRAAYSFQQYFRTDVKM